MWWITGANYEEYIDSKSMASNSWKLDVRGLDSFIYNGKVEGINNAGIVIYKIN
jgi:hypothetical protein